MQLNFDEDYQLENDRVLLRPLKKSDLDHLMPFALNEPEIWKYSSISPAGKAPFEQYFEKAFEAKRQQKQYPFIVYDKLNQSYAGCTRFYDFQQFNKSTQLGYTWYGKKYQRTGLNRNCKLLLLEFAFEKLELDRVEFRADASNERSIRAMKNIGCTVEGILRSHMKKAVGRRDSIVLSILKEEWLKDVKKNLLEKIK